MSKKAITFLGVNTSLQGSSFVDDMTEYVEKIQPAEVKTEKEKSLEGDQLSAYRRLVMQWRWPAHLVTREFLCRVSTLAQGVSKARGKDLVTANQLLALMKKAAAEGGANPRRACTDLILRCIAWQIGVTECTTILNSTSTLGREWNRHRLRPVSCSSTTVKSIEWCAPPLQQSHAL